MRVLVTGGAGMVGSHSAEYYAKKGDDVVILDNLMRSKLFGYDKRSVEYNWNYLKAYKNIKLFKGDIRDKRAVVTAIGKGVDLCIHTAGQPGVGLSCQEPLEDFSINAFGTLNVLETLRQRSKDAVFVYCSTNKVFGENVDKIKLIEKEKRYVYDGVKGVKEEMSIDLTGHTPYGASKYTGDIYAQEYAHIYGMRTAIFRMSCLSRDSVIATPQGDIAIKDMQKKRHEVYCVKNRRLSTEITEGSFKTDDEWKTLYQVKTKRGYRIEATGDHKFFTPSGFAELDNIHYGSLVAVCPELSYIKRKHVSGFSKKIILSEEKFCNHIKKYARQSANNLKYLSDLKRVGLIPLSYRNPRIYIIARLVGYLTGDAHLYHSIRPTGKSYTEIQIYALREEIENIKRDFIALGFKPGRTRSSYSRSVLSNGHVIDGRSYKFSVTSTSAFALFEMLGVPIGHKSKIKFEIPKWVLEGPADIQDEYLRGLFGAEMSRPHFYKRKNDATIDLQPLIFTQSKNIELSKNARHFRRQIKDLLKKRNIRVKTSESKFLYKKGGDKSISFALLILPSKDNFLKFANIGFELNDKRKKSLYRIIEFLKTGLPYSYYDDWIREHSYLLEDTNLLWDSLTSKNAIPMKEIFDITVPEQHNFIANGFFVHNCIYGTRQFGFEDQGWVAHFVISNIMKRPITIYGDGKQVRDALYVDDLVEAYDKFYRSGIKNGVYNIGGGPDNTMSLLEFIDMLEKLTGFKMKYKFSDWRPSDQKVYISDISKVAKELSWKPNLKPCEGVELLTEWVKENKELFK